MHLPSKAHKLQTGLYKGFLFPYSYMLHVYNKPLRALHSRVKELQYQQLQNIQSTSMDKQLLLFNQCDEKDKIRSLNTYYLCSSHTSKNLMFHLNTLTKNTCFDKANYFYILQA